LQECFKLFSNIFQKQALSAETSVFLKNIFTFYTGGFNARESLLCGPGPEPNAPPN